MQVPQGAWVSKSPEHSLRTFNFHKQHEQNNEESESCRRKVRLNEALHSGVVTLPHGTGKTVRVLVLCTPDKENEAKEAGAEYVGLDEYVDKIKAGWTDVDVIICTPSVMAKVGALGRILGPRGLMPNPKTGTVTMEVGNAVKAVKAGKIDFKVDKTGIIHAGIGKVSFAPSQICENAAALLNEILKLKPQTLKGTYLKGATLCTTMSPALKIDVKAFISGSAE